MLTARLVGGFHLRYTQRVLLWDYGLKLLTCRVHVCVCVYVRGSGQPILCAAAQIIAVCIPN